ncbi:MAG: acetate--CoA ligase family protein [Gammaproteobacteria bacterium]|nr:acetate--CoA ligase family protein [Gammaproteobacteria bacterium]
MLSPASVAIVGVSENPESVSRKALDLLQDCRFAGRLYRVNPKYDRIDGHPCYPDLVSLPEVPDLVVMAIGNRGMEDAVVQGIALKVGGIVIFANNYLEGDTSPPLLQRLKQLAGGSGIPVCGGNGMGFYNYDSATMVSFDFPPQRPAGHIALVAHSGSVMTYLANTDPRLMFNLVVSPGQEINGTVADYMLYALAQRTTRVLAVFIETVRDPDHFILALDTARQKNIPVVLVKVGATEKSARMARSHSGAVAGNDTAFQAVCDRYGVIRVADIDELAATALIFSQERRPGPGKLSSLLDSGGLREQMIDLSEKKGVEYTELAAISRSALEGVLEYGLVAENPVDAMGALNVDIAELFSTCLRILHDDPGTAVLTLEFEFRDGFSQYPQLLDVARQSLAFVDKPFVIFNSTVNAPNSMEALELGKCGIPVINGISLGLSAVANMFHYRDHVFFGKPGPLQLCASKLSQWKRHLSTVEVLCETESLQLFRDLGLPTVGFRITGNLRDTLAAAQEIGFPVVLKTAKPGLQHKSERGGVRLALEDADSVESAYRDLSARLGTDVLVAPMITGGVELAFGMIHDDQFGPMVMVCAGGVYIELLHDRTFIPAPCSQAEALHHIRSLEIHRILQGARGKPACRVDLAARALSDFSRVADRMRDEVLEMDLNPVIVSPEGCTIVDALVVAKTGMAKPG